MKAILIVILSFIITGSVSSQYYTEDNPKPKDIGIERDDNLITIHTNQADTINFIKFRKYLVSKGFTMQTKDWEYLLLVTDPKDPKEGLGYDYAFNITFPDSLIVIRVKQSGISVGAGMLGQAQIIWSSWHFATGSGNIMNQSFRDFYPILKEYGYPITFSKE